jgi:hypothetical protein
LRKSEKAIPSSGPDIPILVILVMKPRVAIKSKVQNMQEAACLVFILRGLQLMDNVS